jgi:transposase
VGVPLALKAREMTAQERQEIERLAHSRTEAARAVERARIVWYASQGMRVPAIASLLNISEKATRLWLKRFNEEGLAGLADEPRSGRPATYTPEEVGEVIALAITNPRTLGLPFASWTLDRLQAYLNEVKGIAIKRTRIDDLLVDEGLRWRTQETWFGKRVDPDFAEKRGPSKSCTPSHRETA